MQMSLLLRWSELGLKSFLKRFGLFDCQDDESFVVGGVYDHDSVGAELHFDCHWCSSMQHSQNHFRAAWTFSSDSHFKWTQPRQTQKVKKPIMPVIRLPTI
jgi:hypothetical protein